MATKHLTNFPIPIGHISFFVVSLSMMMSCSSLKQQPLIPITDETTPEERMVMIAIEDFINIKKLFNQDSVFSIRYQDSVYHKVNWNESTRQWQRGPLYQGVKCVMIIGDDSTHFPPDWEKAFPHHYYLKKGKLFLWYGGNQRASNEVISILYQWGIIDPSLDWMTFIEDDAKKAVYYYFKSDGSYQFKKIITNTTGFEPPKGL